MVYRKKIPFTIAVLGGEVKIPALDGDSILKVPAGTQSQSVVDLKGKGMPKLQGRGHGDLHVVIEVEIPHKLSREEADLVRRLGQMRKEI